MEDTLNLWETMRVPCAGVSHDASWQVVHEADKLPVILKHDAHSSLAALPVWRGPQAGIKSPRPVRWARPKRLTMSYCLAAYRCPDERIRSSQNCCEFILGNFQRAVPVSPLPLLTNLLDVIPLIR